LVTRFTYLIVCVLQTCLSHHIRFSLIISFLHLFYLMILGPPRSTLFPYTTLFRSLDDLFDPAPMAHLLATRPSPEERAREDAGPDRKSTRLNSSHGSISYAVFCLKKKKHKTCTKH